MNVTWLRVTLSKLYDDYSDKVPVPVITSLAEQIDHSIAGCDAGSPQQFQYIWPLDGQYWQAAVSVHFDQRGKVRTICRVTGMVIGVEE